MHVYIACIDLPNINKHILGWGGVGVRATWSCFFKSRIWAPNVLHACMPSPETATAAWRPAVCANHEPPAVQSMPSESLV